MQNCKRLKENWGGEGRLLPVSPISLTQESETKCLILTKQSRRTVARCMSNDNRQTYKIYNCSFVLVSVLHFNRLLSSLNAWYTKPLNKYITPQIQKDIVSAPTTFEMEDTQGNQYRRFPSLWPSSIIARPSCINQCSQFLQHQLNILN